MDLSFAVLRFVELEKWIMLVEFALIYLINDVKCVICFLQTNLLFGFGRGKLLFFFT
jgi:hypothetical protein